MNQAYADLHREIENMIPEEVKNRSHIADGIMAVVLKASDDKLFEAGKPAPRIKAGEVVGLIQPWDRRRGA